jgi:hypothetical protein
MSDWVVELQRLWMGLTNQIDGFLATAGLCGQGIAGTGGESAALMI